MYLIYYFKTQYKIMKTSNLILTAAALFALAACNEPAHQNQESSAREVADSPQKKVAQTDYQLIQFHSEHRCMTCKKIEKFSEVIARDFEEVPFVLINVDDDANEDQAREFEATGTALFLYNTKTGEKKNLTEFAFMKAGDEDKFKTGLKAEIETFLKS